jgi:hypothetical protein
VRDRFGAGYPALSTIILKGKRFGQASAPFREISGDFQFTGSSCSESGQIFDLGLILRGHREVEGTSFSQLRFDPYPSAMLLDDLLGDGETDARARVFFFGM